MIAERTLSAFEESSFLCRLLKKYNFLIQKYNFCPSSISAYTLKPSGRDTSTGFISYKTIVKLKDARTIVLDFNLKDFLDEDFAERK